MKWVLSGHLSPILLLSIPPSRDSESPHRASRSASSGTFTQFMPKPGCDHKFLGR